MDLISDLSRIENGRIAKKEGLQLLIDKFNRIANGRPVTLDVFREIIVSKNPFFIERMFYIFDKDGSGFISQEELVSAIKSIVFSSTRDKLLFYFKLYDINGDGFISLRELRLMIKSCMEENGLNFSDNELDRLSKILLEDADTDFTNTIDFQELQILLEKHPGLTENLSYSIEKWILPCPKEKKKSIHILPRKLRWNYIKNNVTSVTFFVIYTLINIILFASRMYSYRLSNFYVQIARGAGQCLNFNCSFILVLMLRKSITILRSAGLSNFLPLDQHIYYHKLCGHVVFFLSILHTIMHILNYMIVSEETSMPLMNLLFGSASQISWIIESANITGIIISIVLVAMVLLSLPMMRKSGHFEIFYYSHLLYLVFWIILLLHAPNFWLWFLIPSFIYSIEKLIRIRSSFGVLGYTYIKKGAILPSRVIHLVIKRPSNFEFQPGDFVFIQIPSIAQWEWHPFTISSAPEMEDVLWVHMRVVGEWTKRVYEYFKEKQEAIKTSEGVTNINFMMEEPTIQQNKSGEAIIELVDCNENYDIGNSFLSVSKTSNCSKTIASKSCSMPDPIAFRRRLSAIDLRSGSRPCSRVLVFPKPMNVDNTLDAQFENLGRKFSNIEKDYVMEMSNISSSIPIQARRSTIAVIEENAVNVEKPLVIRMDGPYGSPSSQIFNTEHAVLIATGIGVTPFASILQSIMFRYLKENQVCPRCDYCWSNPIPPSVMKLKKVDFVWINRDQKSFEWFVNLLSQLELTQAELGDKERFLDIHIYITSALDISDIKAIGLHLALDLMHEKEDRDLITGLKTRTKPGRPKWNEFFNEIKSLAKGHVSLFYCGPPALGKILHLHCNQYGFTFHKENF